MSSWKSLVNTFGGRPAILVLGGLYISSTIGVYNAEVTSGTPISNALFLAFFVFAPGGILLIGGYWLPRTSINPEFYRTVTIWCLSAIGLLSGLLAVYHLSPNTSIDNPVQTILIITGFVVVPAFVGGVSAAKSKTRAFDLEQRNQELQEAHIELEEREVELQRVQERMEFALTNTDAVVWEWDTENDQASYYPSEESLFGTTIENWEDFVAVIHPDDRDAVQQAIDESLETGEPKHEEARIVRNGEIRWIEAPGQPVTDGSGLTRMIGVAHDITDRKTFEQQLQSSNKRLEQFAYVASHDLQEPLRMITSYLNLLENRYTDELDDESHEFIEYAVDGSERMREMIQDLLAYSRLDTDARPLEPTDAEAVVDDVLNNPNFKSKRPVPTSSLENYRQWKLTITSSNKCFRTSSQTPSSIRMMRSRGSR
ncbi:histidine kinase dimerization/phospho-acceptor domain-containing protein [Natrinema sp. DC36]|uniref:sensor histidine kinase n=1 Tax=Natrinema sp. DC36 TaxID=2878680 RepID=UPI001CF09CD7|nr:histidine kinase dimerization/phospho-acceptor domain-containing protein [Natrinema sp. DC36]